MSATPSLPTAPRERRFPHLDALRGIAAFIVVIHHVMLSLPSGPAMVAALDGTAGLGIVALGRPAVVLFFVLSGFVLTLCLQVGRQAAASFALRRILRLMPPYWVTILAAALAHALVRHHTVAGLSPWFNDQWGGDPASTSAGEIGRHMLMLAGPRQYPLDHVAWSLVHEMRLSLALPLLVLVASRWGVVASLAFAAVTSLCAEACVALCPSLFPTGFHDFLFDAPGLAASLVLSARFAVDFGLGLVLAMRLPSIKASLARHPWGRPLMLIAGAVVLSQSVEIAMAVGAMMLIAAVATSPTLARLLDVAPLRWLGRVSYSLYLVHLPIMLACGLLLDGIVPAPAALAFAVPLALLAAEVLCRLVEIPSIRWSRAAAARLSSWRGAPRGGSIWRGPSWPTPHQSVADREPAYRER